MHATSHRRHTCCTYNTLNALTALHISCNGTFGTPRHAVTVLCNCNQLLGHSSVCTCWFPTRHNPELQLLIMSFISIPLVQLSSLQQVWSHSESLAVTAQPGKWKTPQRPFSRLNCLPTANLMWRPSCVSDGVQAVGTFSFVTRLSVVNDPPPPYPARLAVSSHDQTRVCLCWSGPCQSRWLPHSILDSYTLHSLHVESSPL